MSGQRQRNKFSVPSRYANGKLSFRIYADRVAAHADEGLVAEHERSFERGEVCYDWRHYIDLIERKPGALRNGAPFADMPEALRHLRSFLVRCPGGDRLMADVLSCAPRHGLEAVLVAVELILDASSVSAEHVRNVLSRMGEAASPLGRLPASRRALLTFRLSIGFSDF